MIRKVKILILSILIVLSITITITTLFIGLTPLKIVQLEGISMTGIDREHWFHLVWISDDLNLNRNDIVIFDPLKAGTSKRLSKYKKLDQLDGETFTKRILAFEGETVEIKNNQLFINDLPVLQEMVINNFIGKNMAKIKIPKDHYFLAGDYRFNSLDSRYFGPIAKDSIIGKVITFDQPLFQKLSNKLDEKMSKW